jgi:hypothetical protein
MLLLPLKSWLQESLLNVGGKVNHKIYSARRETEGDKGREREVINKLLSQDVPLDVLLIRGSCSGGGAWRPNGLINETCSRCNHRGYKPRERKWDNLVNRRGREKG